MANAALKTSKTPERAADVDRVRQRGDARGAAIDLVHLSKQTLGDRALETELLRLFVNQCVQIIGKLEKSSFDASLRRDFAHTLKGSARAVGASAVAEAAENYESALAGRQDEETVALAALKSDCEEACRQVAALLGEG